MFKEEKNSNNENSNAIYASNINRKNQHSFKINNINSSNNSREQYSIDSFDDFDQEKVEHYYRNKPETSYNNNINNRKSSPNPMNKKITSSLNNLSINEEEKYNNIPNNSLKKPFDLEIYEKDSLVTASDSISLSSIQEDQNNGIENNNFNRVSKPLNNNLALALGNSNNNNNHTNVINFNSHNNNNNNKNSKVILKVDENISKKNIINSKVQIEDTNKLKELEKEKQKEKQMKSRNNQSTFAKNPSQSYAEPYYASFPPNIRPAKIPISYIDFNQFSPREIVYPYIIPTNLGPLGPIAPFVPTTLPYHRYEPIFTNNSTNKNNKNIDNNNNNNINNSNPVHFNNNYYNDYDYSSASSMLQYNLWMRPLVLDDKAPSIHDLLYLENFQRNKDGKSNDGGFFLL